MLDQGRPKGLPAYAEDCCRFIERIDLRQYHVGPIVIPRSRPDLNPSTSDHLARLPSCGQTDGSNNKGEMMQHTSAPSDVILEFLRAEPDHVQEHLYFLVSHAFHGDVYGSDTAWKAVFEGLFITGTTQTTPRIVQISALLDYYLAGPFDNAERIAQRAAEDGKELPPSFQKLMADAPERRRNFEAAAGRWAAIRGTRLSLSKICEFENHLFAERIGQYGKPAD
jgi:hypothetical protein